MPQPPSTRFHVPAALRQGLDPTFPAPIGQSPVCRSSLVKSRYWVDGRKHESTVPAFEAVLERLTDQIRAGSGCHYSCAQTTQADYSSTLRRGFPEIHTCLTAQTCKGPETNLWPGKLRRSRELHLEQWHGPRGSSPPEPKSRWDVNFKAN